MQRCPAPKCPNRLQGFKRREELTKHINKCVYADAFEKTLRRSARKRLDESSSTTMPSSKRTRHNNDDQEPAQTNHQNEPFEGQGVLQPVAQHLGDDFFSGHDYEVEIQTLPPPAPPPPPIVRTKRSRQRRPKRIADVLPQAPLGVLDIGTQLEESTLEDSTTSPDVHLGGTSHQNGHEGFWTIPNAFGVSRRYFAVPTSVPDQFFSLSDLIDYHPTALSNDNSASVTGSLDSSAPSELPVTNSLDIPAQLTVTDSLDSSAPAELPVTDSLNASTPAEVTLPNDSSELVAEKSIYQRIQDIIHPHPNISTFLMNRWFYRPGSINKSKMDRDLLVKDVLLNPAFDAGDLAPPFNFKTFDESLAKFANKSSDPDLPGVGWQPCEIPIEIPPIGTHPRDIWTTKGAYVRSITGIVRSVLAGPTSRKFNWDGFEEWWQPETNSERQRVYHNLYTSDAFLRAEAQLRESEPSCYEGPPRRILGLMFWSDATHLTDFGQSSLHPIYMGFANQDNYTRCHPNKRPLHHIAYIPKLSDELSKVLHERLGKAPSPELLAHLKQEHFHAVWRILLDEAFIDGHKNGIDIVCGDGIRRQEFLRVFTYSTDFQERTTAACIRNLGNIGCPQDLIHKDQYDLLGTPISRAIVRVKQRKDDVSHRALVSAARSLIYEYGVGVRSTAVEAKLFPESLIPTLSAFSERLGPLNPPVSSFKMFANDDMHEWDGGSLKRVIAYSIRMLNSIDDRLVLLLDERYRDMPTFGARIRRFPTNFSQLSNLAAHDYANALLCSVCAFSSLLTLINPHPELQEALTDLLFIMCTFHSLSKLRLHTTRTLSLLEDVTIALGTALRKFRDESLKSIEVRELSRDVQARLRNQNRRLQAQGSETSAPATQRKVVTLNLNTPKNHQLEHYTSCIREFGAMDGYSTSLGEREHCFSKSRYLRTNKQRSTFVSGIAREESIERCLAEMEIGLTDLQISTLKRDPDPAPTSAVDPNTMHRRYVMADQSRSIIILPKWLRDNINDPALTMFMPKLKDHILRRLRQGTARLDDDTVFTTQDRAALTIMNDRLYTHQTLQINYTTYDMRRDYDSITSKHPNIMLLSNESSSSDPSQTVHPYWYARVLKIFHVFVSDGANGSAKVERMDILWVRWLAVATEFAYGWEHRRPLRVGYENGSEHGSGFVDPSEVIRGCFVLPIREYTPELTALNPPSPLASDHPTKGDYPYYDLVYWVDRDMFMRYCGGGPGHIGLPVCDIAWGTTPSSGQISAASHGEMEELQVIATMSLENNNDPESIENADLDEQDLLAEEYDRLEGNLDNVF